jgi:hypothetical protein
MTYGIRELVGGRDYRAALLLPASREKQAIKSSAQDQAMNIFRKRQGAGEVWKSHVIAKMQEPHCWICAQSMSEVDRDFFWFVHEQYYEPEVVDKMRLAHGFCPTHTRHFLQTGANSVIKTVYSYLTWYMITRLNGARDILLQKRSKQNPRELCLRAAAVLRPQGRCPMCANLQTGELINIHAQTHTLTLTEVRAAYEESPGLCLPHFREAANHADWDVVSFLTADMRARLNAKVPPERSTAALLDQAIGLDRERSLRRGGLKRESKHPLCGKESDSESYIELGKPDPLWSPTFEQLLVSLAEPGCPVCSACDQGVRQYLGWLAQQMEAQLSTAGSWESTYNVCPSHLWALHAAGYDRAAMLTGKHAIQEWLTRLDRLSSGLSIRPSQRSLERLGQGFLVWCGANSLEISRDLERPQLRWSKVAAVIESPRVRLDALRAIAFRTDRCEACTHVHTVTWRRLELILRALEDPVGRKAYHAGSGLCLRHCIEAVNLAEAPAALAELLSAQIARLRILEWELEESSRKDNWSVRYEPRGLESDAWRRAAHQFCGV